MRMAATPITGPRAQAALCPCLALLLPACCESPPSSPCDCSLVCAEHEAKQIAALGGAAPDRSRLFIGLGRAELNRTEFFGEKGGLAITMQERVFRTPGCGGEEPARRPMRERA